MTRSSNPSTLRVAVISNCNRPGDPDANLRDHLEWFERAASARVRLALFPELSLSGYSTEPYMPDIAVSLQHQSVRSLVHASEQLGICAAFGTPLRQGGKTYLSHILVGNGRVIGHYEKVHLAGLGEKSVFAPGDEFRVFAVDGVKIGINICYDGRHPGSSLCLAHLGAEVILHPHGNLVGGLGRNPLDWTAKKRAYLGARAVDTCTYTLICNSVGSPRDIYGKIHRYSGGAIVLDSGGRYVARSPSAARVPHMIVADLDIAGLREKRRSSSSRERRADVYVEALKR